MTRPARPRHGGKRSRTGGRQQSEGRKPAKKSRKMGPEDYKKKKYNRNMYKIEKQAEKEESSEESSEEEQTEYNKLVQVFNKNGGSEDKVVTSESESDDEQMIQQNGGKIAENSGESDEENGGKTDEVSDAENGEENEAENEEESDAVNKEESDAESVSDNNEEGSDAELENAAEVEIELEKENENLNILDPYSAHLEVNLSEDLTSIVKEQKYETSKTTFPCLGQLQVLNLNVPEKQSSPLDEPLNAREQLHEQLMKEVPTIKKDINSLHIKPKILKNIEKSAELKEIYETDLSLELLSLISSYKDLIWTERNSKNKEELRMAYSMHALNHALKGRLRVKKNNEKLKSGSISEARDQGLTRPTVLIVVPFSESARQIVKCLEKLIGKNTNLKKFSEKYPDPGEVEIGMKPDDYYETFAGDTDDSFRLGIAVNPVSIRPFTLFDQSDIIVTSPLGLRLILGAEGEEEGRRDYDFINSIELLIMDEMEVLMMQNWQHIHSLLDDIHRQPKNSSNTDFSRVRMWNLDGLNKYYRQTLLFSGTQFPEMNSIFNRECHNYSGKIRVCNPVPLGAISTVFSQVPVVFHRINSSSHKHALEERFQDLQKLIESKYTKTEMDHVLIFFPDYIDFTKARNWFKKSDMDAASVCEYTNTKRIAEVRDKFYHNNLHFLLYTERAHFFKRLTIKGIRHLIFYQLPLNPHFFSELCNLQQEEFQNKRGGTKHNMSCTVLYTKYDACRLIQSVGTDKAATMIKANNDKHKFAPQSS